MLFRLFGVLDGALRGLSEGGCKEGEKMCRRECKVLCHNLCVVIQSVHELGIETNFRDLPEQVVSKSLHP